MVARHGDLVVERDPFTPSGRLLRQGDMDASYVDLADPRHLEFDYLRWMRGVLRVAGARRVLHVGGGACALPRALAAEQPDGRQEVVEHDPDVLEIARAHMGLRRAPGLRVRVGDGRRALDAAPADGYDAVVIDAFVGALVPRSLVTVEALEAVARTAPLVLVNVVDDRLAREVRTVAAGLRTALPSVWAIDGRTGNTVLVGARIRLDARRIAVAVAGDASPARVTPAEEIARRSASTAALRDADIGAPVGGRPLEG